jgi:pimeloyl-ACP methyl ester carboxylesterase
MSRADTRGQGPDLVLVHGVGLDHRMWSRCRDPLARQHRVLSVDLLGHGSAPRIGAGVTLPAMADHLVSDLPGPAHLVGFSLGALVVQALAIRSPELVRSLTLVSSVANRSAEQTNAVHERLALSESDFPATVDAAIQRWMAPAWRYADPELVAELRSTLLANDRESYFAAYRVFATADAELWPVVGEITAPTLVITGGDDPGSTPEMTRQLADRIPGAAAVVVESARHLLPLEEPGRLTTAILTHTKEVDSDRAAAP